jgi:hypothetical protein
VSSSKPEKEPGLIHIKLPDSLLTAVDEERGTLSDERLGEHVSLADAVRHLLRLGLKVRREKK